MSWRTMTLLAPIVAGILFCVVGLMEQANRGLAAAFIALGIAMFLSGVAGYAREARHR